MLLTDGERVVLDAAREKGGGFRNHLIYRNIENGLILSDGHTAYILGNPDIALWHPLTEIAHNSLLGRDEVIKKFYPQEKYLLMQKDFAFYRPSRHLDVPILPDGLSIKTAITNQELQEFCTLKTAFLFEESGSKVDMNAILQALQKGSQGIKPVILYHDQRAIGMANSQLNSRNSAMINMLFIVKEERGNGYGSLLLRWYIHYLLQESSFLCLFYSPGNSPAVKLYEGLGFKKEEDWILALKQ